MFTQEVVQIYNNRKGIEALDGINKDIMRWMEKATGVEPDDVDIEYPEDISTYMMDIKIKLPFCTPIKCKAKFKPDVVLSAFQYGTVTVNAHGKLISYTAMVEENFVTAVGKAHQEWSKL